MKKGKYTMTISIGCTALILTMIIFTQFKTIEENYSVVSESLGNAYAECAILLKKDLEPVYDFLVKTIERRYTLGRYFMIIKVGKLLGKDVSYYEMMYKKSFKFENKLESDYYKNNPQTFMMNNF